MLGKVSSFLGVLCISILIHWSTCVRVLPYKSLSPECRVPADKETCALQGLSGIYRGRKHWKSPDKFVMLWPLPYGNYEKVRRLCHACDLEVAEIWDEDDANQILELMKLKNGLDSQKKFETASFWLGETQMRGEDSPLIPSNEGIQQLKFFHQDGITPVQFHFLRGQKSFAKGYSSASRLPDDGKDCIVIGPDPQQGDKISWFVQSCRTRRNFGICQFKRKHHCYDEAPVPSTRQLELILPNLEGKTPKKSPGEVTSKNTNTGALINSIKPQPYYLSNYPLSWTLAKAACEKDNKSLLFFDSREEEEFFTKNFGKLLGEKEHLEPGFWTAGRFERQTLKWWIGPDSILTIPKYRSNEMKWNFGFSNSSGRTKFLKKTTLDFSRGEGCVFMESGRNISSKSSSSNSSPGKWGIADCQKSMRFFVCKDADVEYEKKSTVEYCEGKNYVMKERFDCKWNLLLKKQKPKCVCVKGVHGLTDHASCNSRLLIGPKCIKLSERGVVHWKILSQSLIESDMWLIVQLRGRESGRFIEWFRLQQNSSRQLFGNANVYYSGLKAVQLDNSRLCFQPSPTAEKNHFYELKIRNSSKISFVHQSCPFYGTSPSKTLYKVHKIRNHTNECKLEPCSKPSQTSVGIANLVSKSPPPFISEQISEEAENSIKKLNDKMLAYKIDKAFGKARHIANDPGPMWTILTQIVEIVKRLCSCVLHNGGGILDAALELFHVAHSGQEYRYVPSFTDSEAGEILSMLEKCSRDLRLIPCQKNNCTGRALKISDKKTSVDDSGLQGIRHHHILEFVWLAVSSVNVACVKHFKASYLAFHHLEQSLENLFTEEMKKLWHYPSVDPNYFQMLLGPTEATDLVNLKSCASAVHGINPKMMELLRPKQAKGRNLAERIHARKINDKFAAQGYNALSRDSDFSKHDQQEFTSLTASSTKQSASYNKDVFCSRDEYCLKW